MNESLIEKIDLEIEASRRAVTDDTIRFVNIKSVLGEPAEGAPFGIGPKMMLDEFKKDASADGFFVKDYGCGVVSASVKDAPIDLGIWLHGDVVPEGEGWIYPPYNATEYKGCVIGRGATDNKGQLAAAYNLMKIFKRLGISLKYNTAIYLGSNEETGSYDIVGLPDNPDAKGFINVATAPRLSLVPDSSWPVGVGGWGHVTFKLKSKKKLTSIDFVAGEDKAPGLAEAKFKSGFLPAEAPEGCEINADKGSVTAYTPPRHGANPDPNGNMITVLSRALIAMPEVSDSDKEILCGLRDLSLDVYGNWFKNAPDSDDKMRAFPKCVEMTDGHAQLTIVIRNPMGFEFDNMLCDITAYAEKLGFDVSYALNRTKPYMLDKNSKEAQLLLRVANEVCGTNAEPFVTKGGTYAHNLPNAYVFGASGNLPPDDFPEGHGKAHGVDECVSIDRLVRMMKIYARALLSLEEIL
ncbi:MAG: M20/M25/M40 family metallo-hydrolase [Clostridia bacterium]|nr:M20/M25/M40 family metallo-hydrolase [Clostridia bacterium]